jgi:hypothetical protein
MGSLEDELNLRNPPSSILFDGSGCATPRVGHAIFSQAGGLIGLDANADRRRLAVFTPQHRSRLK